MSKGYKRRIPTDKEWFDYKHNKCAGWLFCFMSSSATYKEELYYSKSNFIKDLPLIKKFLGVVDKRTINKYLRILINQGYIKEDNENYYFPHKGSYILIDRDLLYNLCITKSILTTQIFIYLTNRIKFKKEKYNESYYNFTIKEIRTVLGYSDTSQNYTIENAINECLQSLKAENYINYEKVYVDIVVNGVNKKVPNYRLYNICDTIPQNLYSIKQDEQRNEPEEFIF